MRNSTKAALLSGLVFPGLGQLVLKHYKRGLLIITAVIFAIVVIIMEAVQRARTILEQIEAEGGPIDIYAITDAANRSAEDYSGTVPGLAFLLIAACWCYAIVDAYYAGKKIDSEKR